jgi:hypothetical protein
LVENIDGMPEDEDVNFPMLGLRLMETRGRGFTTEDVAELWLEQLPSSRVFTGGTHGGPRRLGRMVS